MLLYGRVGDVTVVSLPLLLLVTVVGGHELPERCQNMTYKYQYVAGCYDAEFLYEAGVETASKFVSSAADVTSYVLPNLPTSGVNIGLGFDLGYLSAADLRKASVPDDIINKLSGYLERTGLAAQSILNMQPLVLNKEEADALNKALLYQKIEEVKKKYTNSQFGLDFSSLSKVRSTVLISLNIQVHPYDPNLDIFWSLIVSNKPDWVKAEQLLGNFYSEPNHALSSRRQKEAALLRSDTGEHCCPGVLYSGQCYFMGHATASFRDARKNCMNLGGDLAIVENPDVITKLQDSGKISSSPYWIGATDCSVSTFTEHLFRWVDGVEIEKTTYKKYWLNEGPINADYNCALYDPGNGKISEDLCDGIKPYLCEISMQDTNKDIVDKFIEKKEKEADKKIKSPLDQIVDNGLCSPDSLDCDMLITNLGKKVLKQNAALPSAIGGGYMPDSSMTHASKRKKRNALSMKYTYWLYTYQQTGPNYKVPYKIDTAQFSAAEILNITAAMKSIADRTCVSFHDIVKDGPLKLQYYLFVTRNGGSSGCWSYIGRAADTGPSTLNLGQQIGHCAYVGTIQHELLHALGFWHEHSRTDRDDFITVHYDNVDPTYFNNFDKITEEYMNLQGVSYDYGSILHYGPYAFAMDPFLPVITSNRPPDIEMGQRLFASDNDFAEVNLLYNCPNVINGGWSVWSWWSSCSQTCGGGMMSRTRTCNLPFPKNGGKECVGVPTESKSCSVEDCPGSGLVYRWYGCWEDIRLPSKMISLEGQGILTDDYTTRGQKAVEVCAKEANSQGYSIFGLKAGMCQVLNSTDETARQYLFNVPSTKCKDLKIGAVDAIDVYNIGNGPIQAYYGVWGEYSLCTKTCKEVNDVAGTKYRSRQCNNPAPDIPGDINCQGDETETVDCNDVKCPVDGEWGDWSAWSECSTTCSGGLKARTRMCDNPPPDGGAICDGFVTEVDVQNETCNSHVMCPVRDDCPTVHLPATPAFEDVYEYFSFDEVCSLNNSVPGSYRVLLQYQDNSPTILAPGRKINALFLDNQHKYYGDLNGPLGCLSTPLSCVNGFTVSFWVKPVDDGSAFNSPQMIFTTGIEADESQTTEQGQGLGIYLRTDNTLKAVLKTTQKVYSTDLPDFYISRDKFHHIAVSWDAADGLKLYYGGLIHSVDKLGYSSDNSFLQQYSHFALGRVCSCDQQTFTGYIDELVMYPMTLSPAKINSIFMSVPIKCVDCDRNSVCDGTSCTCKTNYTGNGWHCERYIDIDPTSMDLGAPLFYWPLDNIINGVIMPSETIQGSLDRNLIPHTNMLLATGMRQNSLVFDGRSDWLDAGAYQGHCLATPEQCQNGVTFAFYMNYLGRGLKYNFVFSSGALPWSSISITGFSMWVQNDTISVCAQTSTHIYRVTFPAHKGIWVYYTITWSLTNGLRVYDNGIEIQYTSATVENNKATAFHRGTLVFGKSYQVSGYNGRFYLDELVVYGKELSSAQVGALYAYGVEQVSQ